MTAAIDEIALRLSSNISTCVRVTMLRFEMISLALADNNFNEIAEHAAAVSAATFQLEQVALAAAKAVRDAP